MPDLVRLDDSTAEPPTFLKLTDRLWVEGS